MKHRILSRSIWMSAAFFLVLTSCDTAPKGDTAEVTSEQEVAAAAGKELAVDVTSSAVSFIGNGVGKNHPGSFTIKSGSLKLENDKVVGGTFSIDVNSMAMKETESYIGEKLRPHLLSPDFFDVAKFPEATFEITAVEPYTAAEGEASVIEGANAKVSGNLKLRDQVKNISFPARIAITGGEVKAEASFDIDRTQWGMHYGNDKSLKDKFISPVVNISLALTAKG